MIIDEEIKKLEKMQKKRNADRDKAIADALDNSEYLGNTLDKNRLKVMQSGIRQDQTLHEVTRGIFEHLQQSQGL